MARLLDGFRCAGVPALAAGLMFLAACSKPPPPVGQVSGRVTFRGAPVAEGLVSFMNTEAGTGSEGPLKNGEFALAAPLPPGEYKVTVLPLIERKQDGGKGPVVGMEKPAPDIPQKYRVIGTTDLTATVKEGPNELKFDLKP